MTEQPEVGRVWRVGLAGDPLGFVPPERRSYNNRFDDLRRRFGTLYCALLAETALREVLADLRPNAAAVARYLKLCGPQAASDLPSAPVSAVWRARHVLAPARLKLDGGVLDLTDVDQRRQVELRHAELLAEHGMTNLDLHEITTPRRAVTQTIAADAFERAGTAAIRFASRLDGLPCYALFEGRGRLVSDGDILALTDDPVPEPLENVAASWQLTSRPPPAGSRRDRRDSRAVKCATGSPGPPGRVRRGSASRHGRRSRRDCRQLRTKLRIVSP